MVTLIGIFCGLLFLTILSDYKQSCWRYLLIPATTGFCAYISNSLIITAFLLLCMVGDFLNIFGKKFLTYDIATFSLAHIVLITYLIKYFSFNYNLILVGLCLLSIIGFITYKVEDNLKFPVFIYSIIASASAFLACGQENYLLLSGVLIFYLSDIAIAIFGLIRPWKAVEPLIWLVYSPGIFLIALSTLGG